MLISRRTTMLGALSVPLFGTAGWSKGADKFRLGQSTSSLSYLKIFAARALGTFEAENIDLQWAAFTGDPPTLAAVDSGDLVMASVGSDTTLAAISKGQPFQLIATTVSRMPFQLTVSKPYFDKSGVKLDAPVKKRLGLLKNAVIGVGGLGGAQDRVARWLYRQAGFDPKDIKMVAVGTPPALGAALENGRIDAFVLSPPEGALAVHKGYGVILVEPHKELPDAGLLPSLVWAIKKEQTDESKKLIIRSLRALNKAADAIIADPDAVADKVREKFFQKMPPEVMRLVVRGLTDAMGGNGHLTKESMGVVVRFCEQAGTGVPTTDDYWTDSYSRAAVG